MVLDFLTPIWKINDIDSCRKIRHLYASTLAYQQRSFILCTAFQIQEWESILYDKDESLTSFLLPLPSLRTPAPRRVPQIADAPSTGSHSSTCTQCWIGAAPWRHSISLPSSGRRTLLFLPKSILVWLSEMKPNVQFMLIWYLFSLFLKFKHLTWKCIRPRRRWTSPSCRVTKNNADLDMFILLLGWLTKNGYLRSRREYEVRELIPYTHPYSNDNFSIFF